MATYPIAGTGGRVTTQPARIRIYHITHVANLLSVAASGGLIADAAMLARGGPAAGIGMQGIKGRRLLLPVTCHPGDHVGDYVPFYFCPRSIMLYVIHCANHPELSYRGGQEPIVHLEADLPSVVTWAEQQGRRWAFSLSNAGATYTEFRRTLPELAEVDWDAVAATDFRSSTTKEGKQAEFLVHGSIPWVLISSIGVASDAVAKQARAAIRHVPHQPPVRVKKTWYF